MTVGGGERVQLDGGLEPLGASGVEAGSRHCWGKRPRSWWKKRLGGDERLSEKRGWRGDAERRCDGGCTTMGEGCSAAQ